MKLPILPSHAYHILGRVSALLYPSVDPSISPTLKTELNGTSAHVNNYDGPAAPELAEHIRELDDPDSWISELGSTESCQLEDL